jgi:hypothetical protein
MSVEASTSQRDRSWIDLFETTADRRIASITLGDVCRAEE